MRRQRKKAPIHRKLNVEETISPVRFSRTVKKCEYRLNRKPQCVIITEYLGNLGRRLGLPCIIVPKI